MEAGATMMDSGSSRPAVAAPRYSLPPCRFMNEDVLFCVDVDVESKMEMKLSGPKGRPFTRLDAIRQAILLFVHSKLSINSDHRFAFSVLGQSVSWILIYCRSSLRPQHQWPVSQKLFTFDVIYLHDKPGPENCPQRVYDALVDALEHVSEYEGYILESGHGLSRVLFRHISVLLSHPQQRCVQDDLDIPKSLTRKSPLPTEASQSEESVPVSSQ
ncbi:BRISC and BRCA1-A complex member 1 protein [Dioscorea alata]|uniref:BRISC and BRCA1-A complex member 1 protein n=1 Tax=Dioscorea alata TaxID=55571 RepID=A0ACB7TU17_DIOAL|nr:BRISC and BRCA1-A complex member 1 protein [Dioscorea alata]